MITPEEYLRATEAVYELLSTRAWTDISAATLAQAALDGSGVAERVDEVWRRLVELEAALDEVTRLGPRALLAYRRARRRS